MMITPDSLRAVRTAHFVDSAMRLRQARGMWLGFTGLSLSLVLFQPGMSFIELMVWVTTLAAASLTAATPLLLRAHRADAIRRLRRLDPQRPTNIAQACRSAERWLYVLLVAHLMILVPLNVATLAFWSLHYTLVLYPLLGLLADARYLPLIGLGLWCLADQMLVRRLVPETRDKVGRRA